MEMHRTRDVTTDHSDAIVSLAGSTGVDGLIAELVENGVVLLPPLVGPETLRDMQQAFRARLYRMRCNNIDGYEKELYRHAVQDVLTVAQGFVDIAIHPIIREILQRYLGEYALVEAKGWRSLPTRRDFHGWHGDAWYDEEAAPNMPKEVKLAFYLTDVRSGAFNYIKGSHRQRHPRLVSNQELSDVPASSIEKMIGPAGTAFLFDTSGVHRQGVPILEPREAVFYNYHDPHVKLQPEIVDYYRYHPLILNAAFLGNLSPEDQRILGFGNKVRYQLTPKRIEDHPTLHGLFNWAYDTTLRVRDLNERIRTRLRRLWRRGPSQV